MVIPALIALRKLCFLQLICGTYALPIFEWAKRNIEGADWEILDTMEDPDDAAHPYCPGFGTLAMDRAESDLRAKYPCVLGYREIGTSYGSRQRSVLNSRRPISNGIAIQPYTRHVWKNCNDIVRLASYQTPPQVVGFPDEPGVTVSGFDEICESILNAHLFVGVLSSWTNFAAIFQKRQIIASFTEDVPIVNPNATILIRPTLERLQREIDSANCP